MRVRDRGSRALAQRLVAGQNRLDVEQSEARGLAGGAFDALGIGDAAPEHLIAAANARARARRAGMREDVDVPALGAQAGEIGDRRLRAGQDDEIGTAAAARRARTSDQRTSGSSLQRIEIVEIGDARQTGDGDRDAVRAGALRRRSSATASSAGSRAARGETGNEAERRPAGALSMARMPSSNSAGSPRNLLTRKPRMQRSVLARRARRLVPTICAMTPPRSMSPIRTTGNLGGARKSHVGDVARAQIDLRRRFPRPRPARDRPRLRVARSSPARTAISLRFHA